MNITIQNEIKKEIQPQMMGLFFEDINYASDGGLYAELLENRSFSFVKAMGKFGDYYTENDGLYGWNSYPDNDKSNLRLVSGSVHSKNNPNYLRMQTFEKKAGVTNKAYDGICLKKNESYRIRFWARIKNLNNDFEINVFNRKKKSLSVLVKANDYREETYNFWRYYEVTGKAFEDVTNGVFAFLLNAPDVCELDFISMIPENAVLGLFRKDLFDALYDLHPGFIRFPGGCVVEGNTFDNRYNYKDALCPDWDRITNWNRWAVHMSNEDNNFESEFSHYNQSMGLGFYEFFLLCEKLGARLLPVVNVGFSCQYQNIEQVSVKSDAFDDLIQDTLDLIEFANGPKTTPYGKLRAKMGHPAPFSLTMIGIGNEQWETKDANFFERYTLFEKAIHKKYPDIKLIGSAGPDVTSERYRAAWDFYYSHKKKKNFAYAVDEHYYVKPEWLFENTHFYDNYDRSVKVFSGEYAAHPGNNTLSMRENTLEGALSEAAFLTGVERNCDVVYLSSYAPLFSRIGYTQWAPDMIWFDQCNVYKTPSYYVQKMYSNHMGSENLMIPELENLEKENVYASLSLDSKGEYILKLVNRNDSDKEIFFVSQFLDGSYCGEIIYGENNDSNSDKSEIISPRKICGNIKDGFVLKKRSFCVISFN